MWVIAYETLFRRQTFFQKSITVIIIFLYYLCNIETDDYQIFYAQFKKKFKAIFSINTAPKIPQKYDIRIKIIYSFKQYICYANFLMNWVKLS